MLEFTGIQRCLCPQELGLQGRSCASLGIQVCAVFRALALMTKSGVTGNFKMRWDNDNNSGKTLKGDLL